MKPTRPLILIGGSVFAAKVAEIALCSGNYHIEGFIDDRSVVNPDTALASQLGYLVDYERIAKNLPQAAFFIAIGDNYSRGRVAERLSSRESPERFPSLVHPSAIVAPSARIGSGCLLSYGAILETSAVIGDFVIINTRVSVSHHAKIGDFASMAPCSALAGSASLGSHVALGMGVMVHHGVSIGPRAVVGSLSLVNKDLPGDVVAMGLPARIQRPRTPDERYL